jgi:Spy/CpxP family protein refolding chaperone
MHEYGQTLDKIQRDPKTDAAAKQQATAEARSKAEARVRIALKPEQVKRLESSGGFDLLFSGLFQHVHHILGQLGLSEAQERRIHEIGAAAQRSFVAVIADGKLTPEARQRQAEELHRAMFEKMHEVLTPAQREKLRRLMQNHNGG